jgi:hypothetical protein
MVRAAAEADARFRSHVAPLVVSASNMVKTLSADDMFANAMGIPEASVRLYKRDGRTGVVEFCYHKATTSFLILESGNIQMSIQPDYVAASARDCDQVYGEPI